MPSGDKKVYLWVAPFFICFTFNFTYVLSVSGKRAYIIINRYYPRQDNLANKYKSGKSRATRRG